MNFKVRKAKASQFEFAAILLIVLPCLLSSVAANSSDSQNVAGFNASVSRSDSASFEQGRLLMRGPGMRSRNLIVEGPEDEEFAEDHQYGNETHPSSAMVDPHTPYIRLLSLLPANVTKYEGESVKLKCDVAGSPAVTFTWTKNEVTLSSTTESQSQRIKINRKEQSSVLRINSLQIFDKGFYRCNASNSAGYVQTTALLEVKLEQAYSRGRQSYDYLDGSDPTDERAGDPKCIPYDGSHWTSCKRYLTGRSIFVNSAVSDEQLMFRDKQLRMDLNVIGLSANISGACKEFASQVSCFHRFPPCNKKFQRPTALKLCKHDCDVLQQDLCKAEYAEAVKHNLVGDTSLLPSCNHLPTQTDPDSCLTVIDGAKYMDPLQFCFVGNGINYLGNSAKTESGKKCLRWSEVPGDLKFRHSDYPELIGNNFCRNPGGTKAKPWCFAAYIDVTGTKVQEEYCRLNECPKDMFPNLKHEERGKATIDREVNSNRNDNNNNNGVDDAFLFGLSLSNFVIIVSTVVGLILLALIGLLCYYCLRRKQKKTSATVVLNHDNVNLNAKKGGYSLGGMDMSGGVDKPLLGQTSISPGTFNMMNGNAFHQQHQNVNAKRFFPSIKGNLNNPQQVELVDTRGGFCPSDQTSSSESPLEIPLNCIRFMEKLGEGEFGVVWKGELNDETVAIKTLKNDAMPRQRSDFRHEADLMSRLRHPNIVELLGICFNAEPQCMVFEFMMHGDLHEFLLLRSPYQGSSEGIDSERLMLDHCDFLLIAIQISAGMEYLSAHHYVHRDLATRNCLVADRLVIKIADFGLSRDVYSSDYYRLHTKERLPVRWMSPESILYGRFSSESDIWSFGVTLWEMYSYGQQPYYQHANEKVVQMITTHELLECPKNCPQRMYPLMVECWQEMPSRRPTFAEIHGRLQTWSLMSSPAHSTAISAAGGYASSVVPHSTVGSTHSGHSSRNSTGTGHTAHNSNQTATTQLSSNNLNAGSAGHSTNYYLPQQHQAYPSGGPSAAQMPSSSALPFCRSNNNNNGAHAQFQRANYASAGLPPPPPVSQKPPIVNGRFHAAASSLNGFSGNDENGAQPQHASNAREKLAYVHHAPAANVGCSPSVSRHPRRTVAVGNGFVASSPIVNGAGNDNNSSFDSNFND